jgi:hypothetical protein
MKIKPSTISYILKASIAGKHIEKEYKELEECLGEILLIKSAGETFVGQITIIPVVRYAEIVRQRDSFLKSVNY